MCCRDWPNWPGSQLSNLTSCNCWPIFVFFLTNSSLHLDWGWLIADLDLMFIERKMLLTMPFWLLTAKPLFQARCRQFVTFWIFACFPVHHLLVCNFGRYDFCRPLLSTSPSVWGSLDHTYYAAPSRIPLNGDATSRLISTHFHEISFDPNYSQLRSLTQNPSI